MEFVVILLLLLFEIFSKKCQTLKIDVSIFDDIVYKIKFFTSQMFISYHSNKMWYKNRIRNFSILVHQIFENCMVSSTVSTKTELSTSTRRIGDIPLYLCISSISDAPSSGCNDM